MLNVKAVLVLFVLFLLPAAYAEILSPEKISAINEDLVSKNVVLKIAYAYDPDNIDHIVVGCDPQDHASHFLGGYYHGTGAKLGEHWVPSTGSLMDHRAYQYYRSKEGPEYPRIVQNVDPKDHTISLKYYFPGEVERETDSYLEAVQIASTPAKVDGHRLRHSEKLQSPWETLPERTLFVNAESGTKSHLQGYFGFLKELLAHGALKPVPLITIEFLSQRDLSRVVEMAKVARGFLTPDGLILFELHPHNFEKTEIRSEQEIFKDLEKISSQGCYLNSEMVGTGDIYRFCRESMLFRQYMYKTTNLLPELITALHEAGFSEVRQASGGPLRNRAVPVKALILKN